MAANRGAYTQKVANMLNDKFGRKSQPMLRLLPFIQYTLMNKGKLEQSRMNDEEKEIIDFFQAEKFLGETDGYLTCSLAFYESMNEILWVSYVDCQNQSMT